MPSAPSPRSWPGAPDVFRGPEQANTPPRQARGNASIGAPQSTGGTVSNAARLIAGMRAAFGACHKRGLKEVPDFQATLQLTVQVGPRGEVIDVKVDGKLPPAAESIVRPCLEMRVRSAPFDPPQGNDGRATLTFPVTLVARRAGATERG